MANTSNLSDTQLARIVAPNISDPTYTNDLSNAFEIINENFRKLASAPFLQGVKGDSYTLRQYPIFDDSQHLTKDGAILLNSIFCEPEHNRFSQGFLFGACQSIVNDIAKPIGANSALSYFRNGSQYVNNYVYFQEIIDDANNPVLGSKSYGQLYYFVDGRLKDAGAALENDDSEIKAALNSFCDYSGFYQYDNSDPANPRYIKLSLMPSIYYDDHQNNICWMFNGVKTGISAVGATGRAGKDAVLKFVWIRLNNSTTNGTKTTAPIYAVGETIDVVGFNWIRKEERDFDTMLATDDSALIFIEFENDTEVSHKRNFAFGKIYKTNEGWMVSYEQMDVIECGITFDAINQYFENMHNYDVNTPLRQFIEIPINPIAGNTNYGKHLIGTCCKSYNSSNDNGSLIIHRNSNNSNIEKHVIVSGYDEIELGEHPFNAGINQHFGRFDANPPAMNMVRIKRGDSVNGPEIFIANSAQYKTAIRMGSIGAGLTIDGGSASTEVPVKIKGTLEVTKSAKIGTNLTVEAGNFEVKGTGNSTIGGNSVVKGTAKVEKTVDILGNTVQIGSGAHHTQIKQTSNSDKHFEFNIPNGMYIFKEDWDDANKTISLNVNGDIQAFNGKIKGDNGAWFGGDVEIADNKQIVGKSNGMWWEAYKRAIVVNNGYSSDSSYYPIIASKATNDGAYYAVGTIADKLAIDYIPHSSISGSTNTGTDHFDLNHSDFSKLSYFISGMGADASGITLARALTATNGATINGETVFSGNGLIQMDKDYEVYNEGVTFSDEDIYITLNNTSSFIDIKGNYTKADPNMRFVQQTADFKNKITILVIKNSTGRKIDMVYGDNNGLVEIPKNAVRLWVLVGTTYTNDSVTCLTGWPLW